MKRFYIALAIIASCLWVWLPLAHTSQVRPVPDFDRNGVVDFPDFLLFVGKFGSKQGDERYEDRFDLDGNGVIGFSDFLSFVNDFGKASLEGGDENDVNIPDANLRAVIADSLGKGRDEAITRAEMATLTRFEARNARISDLTGLQFATNLTYLWLTGNAITDLSTLCDLTNLTRLVLYGNAITDISALSNLTNLTQLNLNHNTVSDISVLSNLTNLRHLWLTGNAITDFSALSNLNNLIGLTISNIRVSDISVLSNLTNLRHLSLTGNAITDFSALSNLNNLIGLTISGTNISDISVLSNLTNLRHLWLTGNAITDFSALSNLNNLIGLTISGTNISDISVLSNLTNLRHLWLTGNAITDFSVLSNLTNLMELDISGTNISDISVLSNLTNLMELDISGTNISDISVLSNLTNLMELDISGTNISDISVLSNLTNLMELDINDNCITDLSALSNLTNLTQLNLNNNKISDFSPLVANTGFGSGDVIDVRQNPLSDESLNTHIPALQGRGVDVQFGDQPPVLVCAPVLPQNLSVDAGSSHTLQTNYLFVDHRKISPRGRRISAVAYADFNEDGHIDIFYAPGSGQDYTTFPAELYLNDGAGCFSLDTNFFNGNPPRRIAPRKAIPGDFNGDGRMDVFVLCHGYDKPPFPGEAPYVILSSANGYVLGSGLDTFVGFQHGGASGDIDADGDIDVFVTHLNSSRAPFFLINDGTGSFTMDMDRTEGFARGLYTAELVDVDGDNFLDLLAAGAEFRPAGAGNRPTQILWGDNTGVFSTAKATILPSVSGRGIIVDIDVSDTDEDGDKDIVINRTGDPTTNNYRGYYVQLVEQVGVRRFEDKTAQLLFENEDTDASWIKWIRMCDCNGDGHVDIVVDDAARNLIWENDGTGTFRPR